MQTRFNDHVIDDDGYKICRDITRNEEANRDWIRQK